MQRGVAATKTMKQEKTEKRKKTQRAGTSLAGGGVNHRMKLARKNRYSLRHRFEWQD